MSEVEYKEECGNCRYSQNIKHDVWMLCRRNPPTGSNHNIIDGETRYSAFPMINKTQWCGAWFKGGSRG